MGRSAIRHIFELGGKLEHLLFDRRMLGSKPIRRGVALYDFHLEASKKILQIGELRFQQLESSLYSVAFHGREYTISAASVERAPR
jgi:hypothetical protein